MLCRTRLADLLVDNSTPGRFGISLALTVQPGAGNCPQMGKMPQLGVHERWLQTHYQNEGAASTSTWAVCDTTLPSLNSTRIIEPNGRATLAAKLVLGHQ